MLYEDVEVVVRQRRLTCKTTVEEVIVARVNELLTELGSGYKAVEVAFQEYPRKLLVITQDEEGLEPDEDDLDLDPKNYVAMQELLDELAQLTGTEAVKFLGYYYSK